MILITSNTNSVTLKVSLYNIKLEDKHETPYSTVLCYTLPSAPDSLHYENKISKNL